MAEHGKGTRIEVSTHLTPKEYEDLCKCMQKKGIVSEVAFLRRAFKREKRIMELEALGHEIVFRDAATGTIIDAKLIF